jgi:hypothetical protein
VKKATWPYLAALLLFAVLMALPLGRILMLHVVPGTPDSVTPMALSRALEALQNRTGVYPLWQPWSFSGMPTVEAFSHLSGLYLPNLLFGFLHLEPMYIQFLHLVFAAMGGFVLSRRLGVGGIAAFFAGSAFMLNPFMTAMLAYGHGSQLMTAAWMPWVLWAAIRLAEQGGLASAGLLALCVGLQLQRAHVQVAWYTWMMLVPLLVVKMLSDARQGGGQAKRGVLAVAALLLGVAVALQVYLPVLGYLPASSRSGAGDPVEAYRYATLWSMHPAELSTYLLPESFGFGGITYWGFMPFTDFPHYAGLVVLGFAFAGVVAGRRKPMLLFFTAMMLLSLLLSFGSFFSPVYDLFYQFAPLFRSFRVPSMALIVADLCLALLAGFGLQAWLDTPLSESSRLFRWAGLFVGALAMVFLFYENGLEMMIRPHFPVVEIDNLSLVSMVGELRWELWRNSLFVFILACAFVAGLLWIAAKGLVGVREAALLLVLVSSADLLRIDQSILSPDERTLRVSPLVERSVIDAALEPDEITRFLASRPGVFRIYPVGQLFSENKFCTAGIESTGGYHAAKLGLYQDMLSHTGNLANPNVLRVLNVHYLLTTAPLGDPSLNLLRNADLNLVSGTVPVFVYELSGAMPRAWFAPWADAVRSDTEAVDQLMAGRGTQGGVFVTGATWEGLKRFGSASLLDMKRTAESVTMRVRADSEAFLVLSEIYYPERWLLTVDDQPGKTLKVDGVIRGVVIPPGEHVVSFVYDRSRFERGRTITLVATLLSFGLVVAGVMAGKSGMFKTKS